MQNCLYLNRVTQKHNTHTRARSRNSKDEAEHEHENEKEAELKKCQRNSVNGNNAFSCNFSLSRARAHSYWSISSSS